MADIIQLLPDAIANQIAAGEVVQRPASVVKELMENAIDAGADDITVIVKDAGKSLVQVIDNGSGMSETDARLSFERHATSKIKKAEDLFELRTMGFRGEALASIAAIAHVEMKTRMPARELGTLLLIEGSEVKKQEQTAFDSGTSISVKNLFYNIPARRNFLKSTPVEMKHIIDEFQRLALAYPEKSFELIHGDQSIHHLQPGKLSQRIVSLFGKNYQQQLAACNEETSLIKVAGYIGRPESAKRTRGEQFFFVNNRFIKSNYLNHAVSTAFEGLLPEGTYPFYVLFMEIDPKHIDVNVHPTKTEIKFDDERAVYAVVRSAVRQALGAHNLSPAIDFSSDVNVISKLSGGDGHFQETYRKEQFSNSLNRANLDNWEKLFNQDEPSALRQGSEHKPFIRFESALNKEDASQHFEERTVFQLHNKYVVRAVRAGLMIMDQEAVHERVLYEKFLLHLKGVAGNSQQSLFPQTVELTPADFALVMEAEEEIKALGFRFEVFGKHAVLVSGTPADIAGGEKELFEGLIEQFKIYQSELSIPLKENLARSLAKRASIKSGQKLQKEEMEALVEGLFACNNPNFSPSGSPTFFIFDAAKIENCFNR
ncbi:MAG: DNA mismatch repair endonuclease MutL [Cyclobacteriaceae bacterium]|jgi:DNA mismatch repair protein MutL|nr:DNA mismatch repair endonuclease MutL [Cyclobacteriaceae bacterium]